MSWVYTVLYTKQNTHTDSALFHTRRNHKSHAVFHAHHDLHARSQHTRSLMLEQLSTRRATIRTSRSAAPRAINQRVHNLLFSKSRNRFGATLCSSANTRLSWPRSRNCCDGIVVVGAAAGAIMSFFGSIRNMVSKKSIEPVRKKGLKFKHK